MRQVSSSKVGLLLTEDNRDKITGELGNFNKKLSPEILNLAQDVDNCFMYPFITPSIAFSPGLFSIAGTIPEHSHRSIQEIED